jgi:hypothetical protein
LEFVLVRVPCFLSSSLSLPRVLCTSLAELLHSRPSFLACCFGVALVSLSLPASHPTPLQRAVHVSLSCSLA